MFSFLPLLLLLLLLRLRLGWEGGLALALAQEEEEEEEGEPRPWLRAALALPDPMQDSHLEPECRQLLAGFANSSVRLSGCLVLNARPVTLCQKCHRQFREVTEQMENITRGPGNTTESNPCAKSLLMSDRLQIVVVLSNFFIDTWKKANCARIENGILEELMAGEEGVNRDTARDEKEIWSFNYFDGNLSVSTRRGYTESLEQGWSSQQTHETFI